MKKIFFTILAMMAIALSACSNSSSAVTPLTSTENSLPIAAQLAVGTLKLAGTDQAVTAGQAKDLVVYWETYKQLSQSDTAAQAEYDGLITQIEETLTSDQMQAITDMNISQQDMFASMQGMAVTVSNASSSSVSVSSGGANGDGMPAGGPPADGGGAPPDGGMGGDISSAASASGTGQTQSAQASSSTGASAGIPSTLIEAVIQSLQQVIAA
jgi:hypothetical protein